MSWLTDRAQLKAIRQVAEPETVSGGACNCRVEFVPSYFVPWQMTLEKFQLHATKSAPPTS